MTVCQVKRNHAEERVQAVLKTGTDPHLKDGTGPGTATEGQVSDVAIDVEQYSKDRIRAPVGAKFQGHDLARLVAEVLGAQGYLLRASPPGQMAAPISLLGKVQWVSTVPVCVCR
jgi:restriction system protein